MAARMMKLTSEMEERALAELDWSRLDAMADRDIARQVRGNPDAAPLLSTAETMAGQVKGLRRALGLSQAEFALRFAVPVATLRDWEQARRAPDAAAQAYLRVIAREPAMVSQALRGAA